MKKIIVLLVLGASTHSAFAQGIIIHKTDSTDDDESVQAVAQEKHKTPPFTKGQVDINPGIGIISLLSNALQNAGYQTTNTLPPITLSIDAAIDNEFSIGGYFGIAKTQFTDPTITAYGFENSSTVTHILIGARALYHFRVSSQFDTYAGAMLAYNAANVSGDLGGEHIRALTYDFCLGGRYRFSKHFGVFLELGYGVSIFNLGLNFRCLSDKPKSAKHHN